MGKGHGVNPGWSQRGILVFCPPSTHQGVISNDEELHVLHGPPGISPGLQADTGLSKGDSPRLWAPSRHHRTAQEGQLRGETEAQGDREHLGSPK